MEKGKRMNKGEKKEFELLDQLERLESLREDMEDLGVKSLDDVNRRIEELHRRLDESK